MYNQGFMQITAPVFEIYKIAIFAELLRKRINFFHLMRSFRKKVWWSIL